VYSRGGVGGPASAWRRRGSDIGVDARRGSGVGVEAAGDGNVEAAGFGDPVRAGLRRATWGAV
jgi:hypothetical protein